MCDNPIHGQISPRQALLGAMAVMVRVSLDEPLRYVCALYSPEADQRTRHRFALHTPSGEDVTLSWRMALTLPLLVQAQGTQSMILRPTMEGTELGALGVEQPNDLDRAVEALRASLVLRPGPPTHAETFAQAVGSAIRGFLLLPDMLATPLVLCCDHRPEGWPP